MFAAPGASYLARETNRAQMAMRRWQGQGTRALSDDSSEIGMRRALPAPLRLHRELGAVRSLPY